MTLWTVRRAFPEAGKRPHHQKTGPEAAHLPEPSDRKVFGCKYHLRIIFQHFTYGHIASIFRRTVVQGHIIASIFRKRKDAYRHLGMCHPFQRHPPAILWIYPTYAVRRLIWLSVRLERKFMASYTGTFCQQRFCRHQLLHCGTK